ncbi:hypothetical protein [Nostoc sp.]|uniref:hypothetical protein n=1 Tax=Nostoc sp. TaxID=1180 RepID=UPI002FFC4656
MPNTQYFSTRDCANDAALTSDSLRDATRTLGTSRLRSGQAQYKCPVWPMPHFNVRLSVAKDSRREMMI